MERQMTYSELKKLEVINVVDGARLGCVCDLEIEIPSGRILSLIVPGETRFFGWFKRGDPVVIPFYRVKKFGEDVILVELC